MDQKIKSQISINPENIKSNYGYQEHRNLNTYDENEEENSNRLLDEIDHDNLPFDYDHNENQLHDYDRPEDKARLMNKFTDDSLKNQ